MANGQAHTGEMSEPLCFLISHLYFFIRPMHLRSSRASLKISLSGIFTVLKGENPVKGKM